MRQARTVVQVRSDNFENEYLTFEAYSELRLQMSSGDFGSHAYRIIEVDIESTTVVELALILGDE